MLSLAKNTPRELGTYGYRNLISTEQRLTNTMYIYIYMLHIASQLKYLWNKILKPFHVDADLGVQLRVTEMGNGDIIP